MAFYCRAEPDHMIGTLQMMWGFLSALAPQTIDHVLLKELEKEVPPRVLYPLNPQSAHNTTCLGF